MNLLPERVSSKLRIVGDCWEWTAVKDRRGYGRLYAGREGIRFAHRFVYELLIGEIPPGLELDHLCRNPSCVRPEHLEPVTHAENVRRGEGGSHWRSKTHCANGHPFDEANTGRSRNKRFCRTCHRMRGAENRKRRKAGATLPTGRPRKNEEVFHGAA